MGREAIDGGCVLVVTTQEAAGVGAVVALRRVHSCLLPGVHTCAAAALTPHILVCGRLVCLSLPDSELFCPDCICIVLVETQSCVGRFACQRNSWWVGCVMLFGRQIACAADCACCRVSVAGACCNANASLLVRARGGWCRLCQPGSCCGWLAVWRGVVFVLVQLMFAPCTV